MAINYFRESLGELRKVTWPTRKVVVTHTVLVIVISIVLMALLTLLDFLFGRGFSWLTSFLYS